MAISQSLYQATRDGRQEIYNAYLAAGKGTPFLYPWDSLPVFYLFLALFLRPRLSAQQARVTGIVALAAIAVHSAYICLHRRTLGFAGGYGIGLTFSWGLIITASFLIFHDVQKDFVRLELREASAATNYTQTPAGVSYSIEKDDPPTQVTSRNSKDYTQTFTPGKSKQTKHGTQYRLIWQPMPTEMGHTLDWVIDLMTSFRGPNWNFRIPTLPTIKTLPPPRQFKTTRVVQATILANETHNPSTLNSTSQRKYITETAVYYLVLDLLKTVLMTDPYFLGLRPLDSVSPWSFLHEAPFLTRLTRLSLAIISVVSALGLIFSLEPFFFYVVLPYLVPQRTLIKYTRSPLYDPSMYGRQFSAPFHTIRATGLSGFWGRCWHQMFRFGISQPSIPLVKTLGLDPKSQLSRAIQLIVAFFLTGFLHAVSAYTTTSIIRAKPWHPFTFFMLQAVGIILQDGFRQVMTKRLKLNSPSWIKQIANVAFVLVWLYNTGPYLSDDFARSGVWLFEPVPISPIRGVLGQGWWYWGGKWLGVWKGDSIFTSGLAVF